MRKINSNRKLVVTTIIFLIMLGFSGCNSISRNIEKYGRDISIKEVTTVREILVDSNEYMERTVKLEGKITRQCPTGCWFFLEDHTGTIYVDINPSGLSIPPKVGRNVTVEGIPAKRSGRIIIIGKGVEFCEICYFGI